MKDQLSIKVSIAGRFYPLTIERQEEESIRRAVKLINDKMNEYQKNYNINDSQNLLAMAALPIAKQLIELEDISRNGEKTVIEKIQKIDKLLSEELS